MNFIGKTGYTQHFDFAIPATKNQPERILRAINDPNRDNISSLIFSWNDTRKSRPPKSTAIAVLNDTEQKLRDDNINALIEYDIRVVPWTKKEEHKKLLTG